MHRDADEAPVSWSALRVAESMELTSAGNSEPYGDPAVVLVPDPARALAQLSSRHASGRTLRFELPGEARRAGDAGPTTHTTGLCFIRNAAGEECLALSHDSHQGGGRVVLAALAPNGRLQFRGSVRTQGMSHPSALGSWKSLLAVACEDASAPARLLVYADVAAAQTPTATDQLVFESSDRVRSGLRSRTGVTWMAWTRLGCGRYFGLIGGNGFGRENGWAVMYSPEASPQQRFALVASYDEVARSPRIEFRGGAPGETSNANFIVGVDRRLYLVTIENEPLEGDARLKLFAMERVSEQVPVSLRLVEETTVQSRGMTSFRYASCVVARADGGFSAYCAEPTLNSLTSVYELKGPPPLTAVDGKRRAR